MGKGSKWRKTNYKNFFDNFDAIKFKKKNGEEVKEKKIIVKKNKTTIKYN